jgi:hypothetical protein
MTIESASFPRRLHALRWIVFRDPRRFGPDWFERTRLSPHGHDASG